MSHNSTINFPTEVAGLPEASTPEVVELADGDEFDLRIAPVAKRIGDATVRMLAYNGSIPGPTLKVQEGSTVVVNIENQGDMEATVHWHGLRLENRTTGRTRPSSRWRSGRASPPASRSRTPGSTGTTPTSARTTGRRWACTATCSSSPPSPDYWPPAHRELVLTLDDILLEDGKVAPFSRTETTYSAMGRFGNVLLVSGEPDLALDAQLGEVVRFYLTNTANTRVFKVALPGARMKLVGGDSGHVEHEQFVEDVVLAPSERVGGRRAVRPGRRSHAGASHAGSDLSAGRDQRRATTRPSRRWRSSSRCSAAIPTWSPCARWPLRI